MTSSTKNNPDLFCIALVSILALILVGPQSGAICPDANAIKPCTCDEEGLQCMARMGNADLMRVFGAPAERQAIRRVWIMQTNVTELPARAFGAYIIRDLYMDLNCIRQVQAGALGEAAGSLQSLSLARNQLERFPFTDLSSMKKLRLLGLGHNNLTSVGLFPPSDKLESLDLSHNSIEHIEPNAFLNLHEVSLIDLSRNQLREIGPSWLRVRSSYRHLAISLRNNQINKIAVNAFGHYHPYNLDLSHNHLSYLDQLTFEALLTNDTIIYVEDNPFTCTGCELYKWLLELDKSALTNLVNFVCLDATKLEDLTLETIGCT